MSSEVQPIFKQGRQHRLCARMAALADPPYDCLLVGVARLAELSKQGRKAFVACLGEGGPRQNARGEQQA
jgi:hypothetical protein